MDSMQAFFSSTDNANENANQFYGVYGTVDKDQPMFKFRYVNGKDKTEIPMNVLFEAPVVEHRTVTTTVFRGMDGIEGTAPVETTSVEEKLYEGPWPDVQYPDDWMGQHSKKSYSYPFTGGYWGGKGKAKKWGGYGGYEDGYGYGDYGYGDYWYERDSLKKKELEEPATDLLPDNHGYVREMDGAMPAVTSKEYVVLSMVADELADYGYCNDIEDAQQALK